MRIRLISLILLAALVFTAFAGCGGDSGASGGSADAAAPPANADASDAGTAAVTEISAYDLHPGLDYDGYSFGMLTSQGWSVDMPDQLLQEAETGDVVFDAIFARNRAVEDKLDVKFTLNTVTYGDLAGYLQNLVLAGDSSYDLCAHSPTALKALTTDGTLADAAKLPNLHLNERWYSQTANEEMTVNGRLYAFHSDLGFVWASAIIVMLFNRDMAYNMFALDNLQELALDGGWTLDTMIENSRGISEDLNGDGKLDMEDRHGLAIDLGEYVTAFQYGADIRVTEKDASGQPKLSLSSEKTISLVSKINDYFHDTAVTCITSGGYKVPQEMFRDGKSLFCNLNISCIPKRLREMEDDYGVLPMPKWDEKQDKYYTSVSPGSTTVFCVPATSSDLDRASAVIDCLAYEGHERVIPAFVEQAVKVKYSRDEYSDAIYNMIFDGAILDFGTIYDKNGMSTLFRTLIKNGSNDFASSYAALEAAAAEEYERVWQLFS